MRSEFGWFVIGAMAGIAAGVLLAPAPGSETRTRLTENAKSWRDQAQDGMKQVRERFAGSEERTGT